MFNAKEKNELGPLVSDCRFGIGVARLDWTGRISGLFAPVHGAAFRLPTVAALKFQG